MYLLRENNSRVFRLTALFRVGRAQEPKRGIAQALTSVISKSTRVKSKKRLHTIIDRYGIQIDAHCFAFFFQVDLYCSSHVLSNAIPIFFEILFDNTIDLSDWRLAKSQIIENLNFQRNQTDYWADKILSEYMFQSKSFLGYYAEPDDYSDISLSDIESFYQKNIQTAIPTLFLAGDQLSLAKTVIQTEMNKYRLTKRKRIRPFELNSPIGHIQVKELGTSSQASIRLGTILKRQNFRDFMELEIWNMFLGGYYLSELMRKLRLELGYTYGVYSHLIHFPGYSYFQVSYETDRAYGSSSLEAINNAFDRLKAMETLDFLNAIKQYYSRWSRTVERSLKEQSLILTIKRANYTYSTYKNWVMNSLKMQNLSSISYKNDILDFSSYSKSLVY